MTINFQASIIAKKGLSEFDLLSGMFIAGSSHPKVFYKHELLKKFVKFTGKDLRRSIFYNKIVCWRPATLFTKDTASQMFSCNFCEVFKGVWFVGQL